MLLLLSACIGLKVGDSPDVELSATPVRGVLATVEPNMIIPMPALPTENKESVKSTAVLTVTKAAPVATATDIVPDIPQVGFINLRFALTADGAGQNEFPPGTQEVFAIWEYAGMLPTDTIRRIWFRDDQIWLTREEGWNWGEYGSEGTMGDISVYDNEGNGLPAATYRLQLYVNNKLQEEAVFILSGP